jgi:hypothetical protein
MAKRPTFFLSSTIYDFRDLRSAVKATLEARGCRVLASEFNDFGGDLDAHSYEACLKNIEQADHFILLIGSRVGGWYDEPNQVSITQQEYRAAYQRHKLGQLRIVTLVRDEVWQLREDRKALAKHLATMDMTDAEQKAVRNFPSKFATNAEFISQFISEVSRNRETGIAVQKGTDKPTGNWIHVFKDFKDVQDVIQPLAFTGLSSEEAAYRKALQHELLEMMSRLLLKHKGKPFDPRHALVNHWRENPIDMDTKMESTIAIDAKKWQSFSMLLFHLLGKQIDMIVIKDALTSSIFLDYDGATGAYVQSQAYQALFKLVEEIRMFNRIATAEHLSLIYEYSPKNIGRPAGDIHMPPQKLAMLYGLALRWTNILALGESLVHHLEGKPFVMPELMPFSPIHGMEEAIAAERVSAAETRAFLGL